ncbi:MAG: gamma-glutamylcyclotransferase [Marinobacter sp.]
MRCRGNRHPGDQVIGVIYEIHDEEKPDLDRHEALGFGYEQKMVQLETPRGHAHAWMYYATRLTRTLRPYHWYKQHVITGVRENGLPEDYIAGIEATESVADTNDKRRRRELGIYDW